MKRVKARVVLQVSVLVDAEDEQDAAAAVRRFVEQTDLASIADEAFDAPVDEGSVFFLDDVEVVSLT